MSTKVLRSILIAGPTARETSWPAIEAHLLEND